ncbi:MAG: DUF1349 domain-containing protein [Chitinophagaceae bacterium]|jgi:hypothetical protein|nr:DUF1349 domain-containing protein [Chitinophagaceae bacterium]
MKYLSFLSLLLCSAAALAQAPVVLPGMPRPLMWQNQPASFYVKADSLVINSGAKTDMFRDPNVTYNTDNAPKLLMDADEHFVLTAKLHHAFATKWDGAALVLIEDSLQWLKFCFEKDYQGSHRVVSVFTNGVSDDANHVAATGKSFYFKLAKADNVITLYTSTDGKKWLLVRHLQMNTRQPLKVGFLAQSPLGTNCKVSITNISYRPVKIKDPYVGE